MNNNTYMNIVSSCANCGKGEEEGRNLKSCAACKLVKYCSRDCQIAHRPQHKKECKKRAAELHDEKLFEQPPSNEDCPICFIQLPCLLSGSTYMSCCGKVICSGCVHAPVYDNQGNKVDNHKCPFCRTPTPDTQDEIIEMDRKRFEAGDVIAIYNQGMRHFKRQYGFPQDYTKALELFHQAAELGDARAYSAIGYAYGNGQGVERDQKKAMHYYELAAIKGEEQARHNLGNNEARADNFDRAIKHYMIAVKNGWSESLETIKRLYSNGYATKDDYMKALRLYQIYLGEIKSAQRDEAAAAFDDRYRYY